jgi:hypothetical protein
MPTTFHRPDSPARLLRDGDGLILEHPMLGHVERQVLGVTHVPDDVLAACGWVPDDLTRAASGLPNGRENAQPSPAACPLPTGDGRNADSRNPVEPERETEIEKLRKALRESMRYVESTDGTRGDLVGCAVNVHEFLAWLRLASAGIERTMKPQKET